MKTMRLFPIALCRRLPYIRSAALLCCVVSILMATALAGWPREVMAQVTIQDDEDVAKQIDAVLTASFQPDAPGVAVIVVHNGQVILRKGYGMANLELGVAIKPEMVFRIGSLTKQFTAMAILMLSEEGKLALDDDVTEYLPNFPTHGKHITINNLLTHTSGVKDYELLPARLAMAHNDLKVDELIATFQDEALDFAPGEAWSYSNSGYVLLGTIVEKVSGMSYAEFIQERIFTPLGMTHSYYDDTLHLIPGRAAGYSPTADGYTNAEYISMSHAYAAGALASSVDDLARWDTALYTDTLVKQTTLAQAFKPFVLANGQSTGYGYGWMIGNYAGHPIEEHNGGINGFTAQVMRLPADQVYIAILSNNDKSPVELGDLAFNIATLVIGQPYEDPAAVTLPAITLDAYEGVYQFDAKTELIVRRDGDHLLLQPTGAGELTFTPLSATEFFAKGTLLRIKFVKNARSDVTELRVQRHFGPPTVAPKTNKPLPALPSAVEVDPVILAQYVGEYVAADFSLTVSLEDGKLMAQPAGEDKTELVPVSASQFAIPALGVQIEFVRDTTGEVSGLIVHMGDQEIAANQVK